MRNEYRTIGDIEQIAYSWIFICSGYTFIQAILFQDNESTGDQFADHNQLDNIDILYI
jgi:hypothetical protein